jgi:autophagy-related protein 11
LAAEKEAVANLQKEARSRNDEDGDLKRQMEETKLTKKDLMENMEAQQKEFAEERRSLEDELAKYKLKVEDAEDDLDRVLGSREHERASTDTKIQSLEAEVDQVRHEATEEVRSLVSHIKNLESDLQQREDLDAQRRTSLVTVHKQLSSEKTAPEDHDQLISQLEDLASRSVTHLQDLTQAVAIAKSENQAIRSRAEKMESELTARIDGCETERNSLREQLDIEKAKAVSIKAKLEEQHGHLEDLRTKFAEGETGSEALRQRVSEEESQVEKLSTQLAESKSHAISLDVALMALQKQISKDSETDASRLQNTASRAKEVSRRLYGVHERLLRLLEAFGFLVSYEGETMLLQRASRASASTMLIDPSNSINRSVTTPSPTPLKMHLEDLGDLTFLQWPETDDAEEETQRYKELTSTLDQFDLEMFCEAVMKRMRDMEHTARKFQKETRAYREKYHRAQSEAHEKIAFRSFKDGDLALFLPTRNQATRPWAAFNVGAPHYFLREQDSHKLHGREWLVARISKVEERVVDLSKAMESARISSDSRSITSGVSYEDDNPFELSDGLRWYLLDAAEEKAGAPSTPGLGKTTVASAHVDAKGSIRMTKKFGSNGPTKTLNKSLDSRRSSANSRKSVPTPTGRQGSSEAVSLAEGADSADGHNSANPTTSSLALGTSPNSTGPGPSHLRSHTETEASASSAQPAPERSRIQEADEVRKDLLWGP